MQNLKLVLCDLQLNKLDSIVITATGLKSSDKGFNVSACSPGSYLDNSKTLFCKLSTGRIITLYTGNVFRPLYSDDNGESRHPMPAFNAIFPKKFVAGSDGDLFALVDDGTTWQILYSKDSGTTWQSIFR